MDYITRDEARRDIIALGLPQIVLDAFDEKPLPHNLDFTFRYPYQIWTLGPEGPRDVGLGRITPVWTGGGDYTIVAYHHAAMRQGFFRFDIETAEEELPVGLNWQQVLVKEFKFLWEAEMTDRALREVADLFQFEHLDLLITELSQYKLDSFEKDVNWYQSFLDKIRS